MKRIMLVLAVLALGGALLAAAFARGSEAAPAAAIQRTFVSTSGDDANPCTRAEPCRGFAAAMVNTLAGGEVIALDSGGYGPFTVDKSVSVIGAPGVHAAITVFSGNGIFIGAGPSDRVVLRNLYVTGLGGNDGIRFNAGATLHLEAVTVTGFPGSGLWATAPGGTLLVRNSSFVANGDGLLVTGAQRVAIEATGAERNTNGFRFQNGALPSIRNSRASRNSGAGFFLETASVGTISSSHASGNTNGVLAVEAGTTVTVSGSVLANNDFSGLATGVDTPLARIGGSTVTGNLVSGLNNGAGTVETFGDNLVRGNGTDVLGTLTRVDKT